MEDILGRSVKQGDLVVMMAIGRHSPGMHIGIMVSDTTAKYIKTRFDGSKELSVMKSSNTYIIENPTEQELILKAETLKMYKDELDEKDKKKGN